MRYDNQLNGPHGGYVPWWGARSNHLGGVYPYLSVEDPDYFALNMGTIIQRRRELGLEVALDQAGVAARACMPYLIGNRTILSGVQRAPWMSAYRGEGRWKAHGLPEHGNAKPSVEDFSQQLVDALVTEARDYIGGARKVGILLSGGMDSRIAAAAIREVQENCSHKFDVVAYTWGAESSRDVVYAKRVAKKFDWDVVHYVLNAEVLARNIDLAGDLGADLCGLHLHAMPEIAASGEVDVIVAGSYGDSVGRGEFSGQKLTALKSVIPTRIDRFSIVRRSLLPSLRDALRSDANAADEFCPRGLSTRRLEIEQQMHYMRRMLQACMTSVIAPVVPLHQMFTAPQVFGLMWGLSPDVRDDVWYERVLLKLPGDLLSIPWARTGSTYPRPSAAVDCLPKQNHSYGVWLRRELRDMVLDRVSRGPVREIGIFNDAALDGLLRAWQGGRVGSVSAVDETVCWLASLHVFLESHQPSCPPARPTLSDTLRGAFGTAHAHLFMTARNLARE